MHSKAGNKVGVKELSLTTNLTKQQRHSVQLDVPQRWLDTSLALPETETPSSFPTVCSLVAMLPEHPNTPPPNTHTHTHTQRIKEKYFEFNKKLHNFII